MQTLLFGFNEALTSTFYFLSIESSKNEMHSLKILKTNPEITKN